MTRTELETRVIMYRRAYGEEWGYVEGREEIVHVSDLSDLELIRLLPRPQMIAEFERLNGERA